MIGCVAVNLFFFLVVVFCDCYFEELFCLLTDKDYSYEFAYDCYLEGLYEEFLSKI